MNDEPTQCPAMVADIRARSTALGFDGSCQDRTGALLRTLAATKPHGRLLELGTGTGVGTAWILDGMTPDARLITVDRDPDVVAVATGLLGSDPRVEYVVVDVEEWLARYEGPRFDFVFVDCRTAKVRQHEAVMSLLQPGAVYVADDLHPRSFWTQRDEDLRDRHLAAVTGDPRLRTTALDWASGIIVAARV
jgi:predicted O-methyltransferase YrrM